MGLLDDAIREHLDLKRRRGADPGEVERAEREALGPVRRGPQGYADLGEPPPRYEERAVAYDEPARGYDEPAGGYDDHLDRLDVPYEGDGGWVEATADRATPGSQMPRDHEDAVFEDDDGYDYEDEYEDYDEPAAGAPIALEPELPLTPEDPLYPSRPAPQSLRFTDDQDGPADGLPPHLAPGHPDDAVRPQDPHRGGFGDETAEWSVEEAMAAEDAALGYPREDPAGYPPAPPASQAPSRPPAPGAPSRSPQAPAEEDMLEETPEFLQDTPDHDRLWFEQKPPRDFDFDG